MSFSISDFIPVPKAKWVEGMIFSAKHLEHMNNNISNCFICQKP